MGNEHSQNSHGHHNQEHRDKKQRLHQSNQSLVNAFNALSNGTASVGLEQLKPRIGSQLALSLWPCLQDDDQKISLEQFLERADRLLQLTSDDVVRLLKLPLCLVEACLESVGLSIQTEEERDFVNSLVEHMESYGKTADSLIDWKNSNCARMCQSVVERTHSLFSSVQFKQSSKIHSGILNDIQILSGLQASEEDWVLLYSSARDGLSTTRFESKAFNYRGPSVLILCQTSKEIYAVAADEEWRHSSKAFGGPYSMLYKLFPKFDRTQAQAPAICCNFKSRSSPLGYGSAERNAKVPLPGKWAEEKAILEMAGYTFSSERRD
uniref:TLDc domain-containing protein n=1 Tax=Globodera rostochiensis TaxID=31243 RepID=A0A914HEQ0_GLORO